MAEDLTKQLLTLRAQVDALREKLDSSPSALSAEEVCGRYSCSLATLKRWVRERDITRMPRPVMVDGINYWLSTEIADHLRWLAGVMKDAAKNQTSFDSLERLYGRRVALFLSKGANQ